jgi:aminodeoxyfutalosine deaminase
MFLSLHFKLKLAANSQWLTANTMRKLSADIIYPITSEPVEKGVLIIDDHGKIIDLLSNDTGLQDVEYMEGSLCPGFINTHCHLELSHLRGLIAEKTGLIDFILELQKIRNFPEEEITDAIEKAEDEMIRNGIVAVGDISNTSITATQKRKQNLYYHTFIELLGFNPDHAETIFNKGLSIESEFEGLNKSLTPHAPYSVSSELMQLIANKNEKFYSIHNQESEEENKFARNKTGDFLRLYQTFNINIDHYQPSGKSSLMTYLPYFEKKKILLVHNSHTSVNELSSTSANTHVYWCLCPNANLYIENELRDIYVLLKDHKDHITIGTDSLASNHSLNICSEIQTIHTHYPEISLQELFKWATLNGAKFLEIDDQYGSFRKGKTPGVNLISHDFFSVKKII